METQANILDKASKGTHQAVDKVTELAQPAGEWLSDKGEQLKGMQEKLVNGTVTYVKQHPYASAGIALATGLLITKWLKR